jgi:hypothetical protein
MAGTEANGRGDILRVTVKGKRRFQIGDREPFEIDAVYAYSQWCAIDRSFRDPEGKVPAEASASLDAEAVKFVREVAGGETPDETIDMGEALAFLKLLADVNKELMPFFVPASSAGPSSQGSTELLYST